MVKSSHIAFVVLAFSTLSRGAEDLGEMWGTAAEEAKYYPITNIPIPATVPMRPGGLEFLPNGRLAVGAEAGVSFVRHRAG
jgi:hypothetical protein